MDNNDAMNRKTAMEIARTIRAWSSTNDCKRLEELVFTALQIAEKRGEVVEKHRSSNNTLTGPKGQGLGRPRRKAEQHERPRNS